MGLLEVSVVVALVAVAVWLGLAGVLFNLVAYLIEAIAGRVGHTRGVNVRSVRGSDGRLHATASAVEK